MNFMIKEYDIFVAKKNRVIKINSNAEKIHFYFFRNIFFRLAQIIYSFLLFSNNEIITFSGGADAGTHLYYYYSPHDWHVNTFHGEVLIVTHNGCSTFSLIV